MPDYIYGDWVYFNNIIDAPTEHNNKLILNQEPYFYITSLSKLMDETFTSLSDLFVDKMIKEWHQSCGSVIKNCKMEQTK